ncbi:MAG: hypothetical protein H8E42_04870 [Nitrospinae bacterium]|nr:hypothetical protein [Nitrospinota bacterium]MBL7019132.1 hypothetical protein [Nitrospinaceae bacterium]
MSVANPPPSDPEDWRPKDLEMISHVEVFQNKPAILKKVESRLTKLKKAMVVELLTCIPQLPPGTNIEKGQIARGENHNGFPFLSLDIPQNFSKTEMFTFRTLFWWGHYLGFSMILKGDKLKTYFQRLSTTCNEPPFQDIYLSLAPTPWEWRLDEKHFSLVGEQQVWANKANLLDHMKIMRFYSIADESFKELDWTQAGVKFWKDVAPVCLG